MVPSDKALFLHWKRSCWVLDIWRQADENKMMVKPITQYGGAITQDNRLSVIWDSDEHPTHQRQSIKDRVNLLLRGYKFSKGCLTARCFCR